MRDQSVGDQVLVFDIGGHGVRVALADNRTGALLRQEDLPETRRCDADANVAFEALLKRAAASLDIERVDRVVIAAPGPVLAGRVERLPTLYPANKAVLDLAAIGRRLWPEGAVWVANDITAAGFAFVAKGCRDFCIFTCGSGIGGKLFLAGVPQLGRFGMGGEFGHWRVPGAPDLPCDCGGSGHLGALASGHGVVRLARHLAGQDPARYGQSALARACPDPALWNTHLLAEHFLQGDHCSIAIIDRAAQALGATLALIHLATGIELFFITGGFGTALGAEFAARIAGHAKGAGWPTGVDWDKAVTVMEPDVEYGLIGAAMMTRFVAADVGVSA